MVDWFRTASTVVSALNADHGMRSIETRGLLDHEWRFKMRA